MPRILRAVTAGPADDVKACRIAAIDLQGGLGTKIALPAGIEAHPIGVLLVEECDDGLCPARILGVARPQRRLDELQLLGPEL